LPTNAAATEDVSQTISQVTHRGAYGVELRPRAAHLAERAGLNPTPRNIDREGMGLIDWPEMNKAVGDALDRLTTQWMKPKSIWGMMRALKFLQSTVCASWLAKSSAVR